MIPMVLTGPIPQAVQQGQELCCGQEGPVDGDVGLAHVGKRLVEALVQAPEQPDRAEVCLGHNI